MLVLTRRVNETVMLGDDITVTILGINNHQVRLGLKAPGRVPVPREEVYEKIRLQGEPETGTD